MRRFVITIFLFGLVFFSAIIFMIVPYHFYYTIVTDGIRSDILQIKHYEESIIEAGLENIESETTGNGLFIDLHFLDYLVPIPHKHPSLFFSPAIKYKKSDEIEIGYKLLSHGENEILFEYQNGPSFTLEFPFNNSKLFSLPLFKTQILKKNFNDIFTDVFSKDLSIPAFQKNDFFGSIKAIWEFCYKDLVYNIYLLLLRDQLNLGNVEKLSLIGNRNFGLIKLSPPTKSEDLVKDKQLEESVFLKLGKRIQRINITTKKYSKTAMSYRRTFINRLRLQVSGPDSSISIYATFKEFSIKEKASDLGLAYLFCAWGHDPSKDDFLKNAISYVEKYPGNQHLLTPIYNYLFRKYGTNFSTIESSLREKSSVMLKRKTSQENKKSFKKSPDLKALDTFKTDEERIKYYLKKTPKESLKNKEGVIIVE